MTERGNSVHGRPAVSRPAVPVAEGRSGAPPHSLLDLQRAAGNRAVSAVVDRLDPGLARGTGAAALQRVEVKEARMSETLYNQSGAGGKAKAKDYAITPAYVLSRNGDSGVTVKVRVKFLHQVRDATGALTGTPVEIPANDPDDR